MSIVRRSIPRNPLFDGRWFEDEIVILCSRSYFRYKLSFRDLIEIMGGAGIIGCAHDESTVGGPVHRGIREAVASLASRRRIVEGEGRRAEGGNSSHGFTIRNQNTCERRPEHVRGSY